MHIFVYTNIYIYIYMYTHVLHIYPPPLHHASPMFSTAMNEPSAAQWLYCTPTGDYCDDHPCEFD